MKLHRLFVLSFLVFSTINVRAQIGNVIREIFKTGSDSIVVADSIGLETEVINQDSLLVVQLLEEAKLNEANLRMEFEQFKLNIMASDSIKRRKQRHHIDSLRHTTKGSPVEVEGDTLFYLIRRKAGNRHCSVHRKQVN